MQLQAMKNKEIIGCCVGSIERYPWMATPLPTECPFPVQVIRNFYSDFATKETYKKIGIKMGTRVYVTKLYATRNDYRRTGIASKLMDKCISMARENKCKFVEVISTSQFVHEVVFYNVNVVTITNTSSDV